MEILMNAWYIISFLIGSILILGSLALAFIGILFFLIGIPSAIKEGSKDEIPFLLGFVLFCVLFISLTIGINISVTKQQKHVYSEIPNIVSYDGITNVKEGKSNNDYLYFKQGTNNTYTIFKINPYLCRLHYTNDKIPKVISDTIEYTSPFRYFSLSVFDDNTTYDVYLPKE